jgi:chorismate dehydratase
VNPPGRVRVGAVGYLNARPLVYGLDCSPRFQVRYDVPSECARLLHDHAIDIGLIPSIEYLRGGPYCIVPGLAIASRGPVASVMLYTRKAIGNVRSIATDTSSRTSVALLHVLCARFFNIHPAVETHSPDLQDMLSRCDAALIIGDVALFLDPRSISPRPSTSPVASGACSDRPDAIGGPHIEAIDLGDAWNRMTGLPFVYAFWAGRPGALSSEDVVALQRARDEGVGRPDELAQRYLADRPACHELGVRYLRDNIKYHFGADERAGLELFYRYAEEVGVVERADALRFF